MAQTPEGKQPQRNSTHENDDIPGFDIDALISEGQEFIDDRIRELTLGDLPDTPAHPRADERPIQPTTDDQVPTEPRDGPNQHPDA
jgi:hypothetical protein